MSPYSYKGWKYMETKIKSRVFIIEPPRQNIDTSKAKQYGDIVYIFGHDDRRCSVWSHVSFGQTVLQRLEELNFDVEKDFVCIVGAMVTVLIAIVAVAQCYEKFSVLLFNRVDGSYVLKQFDWNDWKGNGNETKRTRPV